MEDNLALTASYHMLKPTPRTASVAMMIQASTMPLLASASILKFSPADIFDVDVRVAPRLVQQASWTLSKMLAFPTDRYTIAYSPCT